jgi:hypothetical protein
MPPRSPFGIRHSSFVIPPRRGRRGGFALLITITLLAFLVLLLVSLASLTRVETQVAANNQDTAKARQNALMALNLALGQLQKHAGPDQRVTARADVTIPTSVTVTNATAASAALTSIDTHWRAGRNRHWTGVWLNNKSDPADFIPGTPSAFNPEPVLQSWLVSGNENAASNYDPDTVVTGLSISSTPADRLLDANKKHHRLLVKASAGVTVAADLDRAVTAPEIEIRTTAAPGTGGTDTLIGHYAWWVGDEGVKARANLIDRHAQASSTETPATAKIREAKRRQSAQRTAIEAMTLSGTDGLAPLAPYAQPDPATFQAALGKTLHTAQLGYLKPADTTLPAELSARFHDLSITSHGVLSDTKHGGLKSDLTYVLGQPTLSDFKTALNAVYLSPDFVPSASPHNAALNPVTTLYATLPSNDSAGPVYNGANGIFSNGATWEQLWSFHNMGNLASPTATTPATPPGVFVGNEATPRRQTAVQHGLYPLIMHTKLFYALRIVDSKVWVDISPVVVIANPYNVDLAPFDYVLRYNSGFAPRVSVSTGTTIGSFPSSGTSIPNSLTGKTRFILRSTGIPAGKAHIFTIDQSSPDNALVDQRITIEGATAKDVILNNFFNPQTRLTWNSNVTLAPGQNAALVSGSSPAYVGLYMDHTGTDDPLKAVHYLHGQFTAPAADQGLIFLVEPTSSGERLGGGVIVLYNQPPGSPATSVPQQAPFYQVNYRAIWAGYSGSDFRHHPTEYARTIPKNAATATSSVAFNPWLAAHLMMPDSGAPETRWGIVNQGENASGDAVDPQTLTPQSVGGDTNSVGFTNLLYDIPRTGNPLSSLGQLQHFNTVGFFTAGSFGYGTPNHASHIVNTWQVNYPLSNSYPHPRVFRDQVFSSSVDYGLHFDGSYLWNDLLWDRFYFSTYPQSGSFDFDTQNLTNARYRPFRDTNVVPPDVPSHFRGDGNPATSSNSRIAAQNLMVEGAFNVNSTSVEAWKAVFSSLKNTPIGTVSATSAPFSRILTPTGGSTDAEKGVTENSWNGFRDLTRDQIQALAEEMVMQVRKRGPFLSLSEFVNRQLIAGRTANSATSSDPLQLGLSGALQSAIDRVTNKKAEVTAPLNTLTKPYKSLFNSNSEHNTFMDTDYIMPTGLSGFPGYLLQADILSSLGSTLAARSDTFIVRTYGDSVNSATGDVTGRAWCEAVVQRMPDYVIPATAAGGDAAHITPPTHPDNLRYGRRLRVVAFRWLSPEDI